MEREASLHEEQCAAKVAQARQKDQAEIQEIVEHAGLMEGAMLGFYVLATIFLLGDWFVMLGHAAGSFLFLYFFEVRNLQSSPSHFFGLLPACSFAPCRS